MAKGPLLALFGIGLLLPAAGQRAALAGFGLGLLVNLYLWLGVPSVSWLWWNVSGLLAGLFPAIVVTVLFSRQGATQGIELSTAPRIIAVALLAMTALILGVALELGFA